MQDINDYEVRVVDVLDKVKDLLKKKNADYTNNNKDRKANFRRIEELTNGSITGLDGILTRMSDKVSRIASLHSQNGSSHIEESLEDNLYDLIGYCVVYLLYKQEIN